jgi:hypothetical protein
MSVPRNLTLIPLGAPNMCHLPSTLPPCTFSYEIPIFTPPSPNFSLAARVPGVASPFFLPQPSYRFTTMIGPAYSFETFLPIYSYHITGQHVPEDNNLSTQKCSTNWTRNKYSLLSWWTGKSIPAGQSFAGKNVSLGLWSSPGGRHSNPCSSTIVFVAATERSVIDGVTCALQTGHDVITIICP